MAETDLQNPGVRVMALVALGVLGLVFGSLAFDLDRIASFPFVVGILAVVPLFSRRVRARLLSVIPERDGDTDSWRDVAIRVGAAMTAIALLEASQKVLPATINRTIGVAAVGAFTAAYVLAMVGLARGVERNT